MSGILSGLISCLIANLGPLDRRRISSGFSELVISVTRLDLSVSFGLAGW